VLFRPFVDSGHSVLATRLHFHVELGAILHLRHREKGAGICAGQSKGGIATVGSGRRWKG
jgi:hypothetical protein